MPFFVLLLVAACSAGGGIAPGGAESFAAIPVAPVPASFPVNFALFTAGDRQYVAFYDTAHQLTIASRRLAEPTWDHEKLGSQVGWDSHNYLSLLVDDQGIIHLSGNMHSSRLEYFRSAIPFDIHSLQGFHAMTGKQEDVTTYPEFMRGPRREVLFHYRHGRSGAGSEVFNLWDAKARKWTRLFGKPLTDGRGRMNAYMQGPTLGPDGFFHLLWMWRDTPDCASNHTLSYARSRDLLHWESMRGEKAELPLTIDQRQLIVDATPARGGLINTGIRIGFSAGGQVLVAYHKYDAAGNTQLFLARHETGGWMAKQVSAWNYRWDFKGEGTVVDELRIEAPKPSSREGEILIGYHHVKYGSGQIVVAEETLGPVATQPLETEYPGELDRVRSPFPGIQVNKVFDSGKGSGGKRYLLRWETLAPNRDQKPKGILPPDTMLELVVY